MPMALTLERSALRGKVVSLQLTPMPVPRDTATLCNGCWRRVPTGYYCRMDKDTAKAIEDIAAATRPPPLKPPEVFNGRLHNPRHRKAENKPQRPGLMGRLLKWFEIGR